MADVSKPLGAPPETLDGVKSELGRILASPPFRNSRRCQALLSYVVDAACDGRAEDLKERVVGISVFGRDPDYDTNHDAVVRNAAAEVRKRLAQYYLEHGSQSEIRIDLLPGSYVPEFRPVSPRLDTVLAAPPQPERRYRKWIWGVAAGAVLTTIAVLLVLLRGPAPAPGTDLDHFWNPLLSAPGAVQICVGQSRLHYYERRDLPPQDVIPKSEMLPMRDRFVWYGDAICMSRLSGYLVSKNKPFRLRGALTTPYSELRGNAVVLIGAFNNEWAMRLTQGLRFSLVGNNEGEVAGVRDRSKPEGEQLMATRAGPWVDASEDFALVTRVFDADTERWVVATGGISHFGTMMTGDFLSNHEYFRQAVQSAPADWMHRNMQIVLQTKIVEGTPGPPRVLAVHFW